MFRKLNPCSWRKMLSVVVGLAALTGSGCVSQQQQGNIVTYYYAPWVGGGLILGLILLIGFVWLIKRSVKNFLWGTALLLLMGVIFIPGTFLAHVKVNPDGFETHGPYMIPPERHAILFENLEEIQVVPREGVGRDAAKTYVDWHFKMRVGGEVVISGFNLLTEASDVIAAAALRKSVRIKLRELNGGWTEWRPKDFQD